MVHTQAVVPLNVLLSRALLDLTRCVEATGAAEVVLWSNLLRVVDEDGVDRAELPSRVRLSRRVVKTTVNGMARHGWVTDDGGVVRLSDVARGARDEWGSALVQAEANWPGAASLRSPLEAVVSELPLESSHYPCGYGTADWRITGGSGVDWKPVPRDRHSDTVSSLSVLALLSQALVGFSIEYESRVPFALLVGVYFDSHFADGALPLTGAPPILAITGNGKSSLERHGAVIVDRSGQVVLTPVGQQLRDAYRPAVASIESSWGQSAATLRAALEAVKLQHVGHADHPDVRHVRGYVGFAEVSTRM